jgi:hypothetical protein
MRHVTGIGCPSDQPPPRPPERIALRLPGDLLDRIDQYAAMLGSRVGVHVTRSEAVRLLLESALSDASGWR